MIVRKVPFSDVEKQNFKPEPHTVILNKDKPDSEWWALFDDNKMVCVICIVRRKNEVHFARTYTPPECRKKGYCTTLLRFMCTKVFPNEKLTAHCLKASVHCYASAGFKLKIIRNFKHGKMFYMERGKK